MPDKEKKQNNGETAEKKSDLTLHRPLKKPRKWREYFRGAINISEDNADPELVRERILSAGRVTGTNLVVLMMAIMVASIGLIKNSTAAIIGAMLISPLMGSLYLIAYGMVTLDRDMLRRAVSGFALQILISVGTSTLFFLISPYKAVTAELAARTSPDFFDVLLAIFGGLAGIIGFTRKDPYNSVIPGVAIATALMPPLCTCGFAIANGRWRMLAGALYLFIINSYFIFSSAEVVLSFMKLPKVHEPDERSRKRYRRRKLCTAILVSLPSVLLGLAVWQW